MTEENISQEQHKLSALDKKEAEYWTAVYLEEQLFLNLASIRSEIKIEDSGVTKTIHYKKYYRQALQIMYRIPLWRPTPTFIIFISDLSDKVKSQLYDYYLKGYPRIFRQIVTQAVGRIFENLNFEYYHLNIAHHLLVRIENECR